MKEDAEIYAGRSIAHGSFVTPIEDVVEMEIGVFTLQKSPTGEGKFSLSLRDGVPKPLILDVVNEKRAVANRSVESDDFLRELDSDRVWQIYNDAHAARYFGDVNGAPFHLLTDSPLPLTVREWQQVVEFVDLLWEFCLEETILTAENIAALAGFHSLLAAFWPVCRDMRQKGVVYIEVLMRLLNGKRIGQLVVRSYNEDHSRFDPRRHLLNAMPAFYDVEPAEGQILPRRRRQDINDVYRELNKKPTWDELTRDL